MSTTLEPISESAARKAIAQWVKKSVRLANPKASSTELTELEAVLVPLVSSASVRLLDNGRIEFLATKHVAMPRAVDIRNYANGKAMKKAINQSFVPDDLSKWNGLVVKHKTEDDKVFCIVTKTVLNLDSRVIDAHINSAKCQKLINKWQEEKDKREQQAKEKKDFINLLEKNSAARLHMMMSEREEEERERERDRMNRKGGDSDDEDEGEQEEEDEGDMEAEEMEEMDGEEGMEEDMFFYVDEDEDEDEDGMMFMMTDEDGNIIEDDDDDDVSLEEVEEEEEEEEEEEMKVTSKGKNEKINKATQGKTEGVKKSFSRPTVKVSADLSNSKQTHQEPSQLSGKHRGNDEDMGKKGKKDDQLIGTKRKASPIVDSNKITKGQSMPGTNGKGSAAAAIRTNPVSTSKSSNKGSEKDKSQAKPFRAETLERPSKKMRRG